MTDEQRKSLLELEKLRADDEAELQAAEKEKEEAEKGKQKALAAGDKKEAKEQQTIVAASESSIQNLTEKLCSIEAQIDILANMKGPEVAKAIQEARRKKFLRTA